MKWFEQDIINDPNYRHVLGISGGKDSAALAIYIRDRQIKGINFDTILTSSEKLFDYQREAIFEVFNLEVLLLIIIFLIYEILKGKGIKHVFMFIMK